MNQNEDSKTKQIREELVKQIIDEIFDKAEKLVFAWHYGEEALLVSDIINLINNVAGTDYMRYGSGMISYKQWNPHCENSSKCYHCEKYFTRHAKAEHNNWCLGKKDACGCTDFEDTFGDY